MSARENACKLSNPTPASKPAQPITPYMYLIGQDVLARWSDGLFYLGNVLKVDDKNERCSIKFEDDSEHWALFKDISQAANQGEISCCLCRTDASDVPNEIVLCDNCGLGYHQSCHNPPISCDVLQPDVEWLCRLCVFATTVKRGGALKKGPNAKALQVMKQSLPYNLSLLTWDALHKTNLEHCYCYCGGPGEWYLKMLQCWRCRQWFHEACMQCLENPLVYGDRWFIFVCSLCNSGSEYLKRLDLKWVDIAQLALFNLTIENNKKYHDLIESIVPWITENWDNLQLARFDDVSKLEIQTILTDIMKNHRSRFQCGREVRKRMTFWGLRVRLPPPPPTLILPAEGQITDEVMSIVQIKGRKTKQNRRFVPLQRNSTSAVKCTGRRKGLEECIALTANKAKKLLDKVKSEVKSDTYSSNQEYRGHKRHCEPAPDNSPSTGNGCTTTTTTKGSPMKRPAKCTLDSYIPRPSSYTGHNHPFKTVLEQTEELEQHKLKERLLNLYQNNGYETDTTTTTSQSSQAEEEDSQTEDSDAVLYGQPPILFSCVADGNYRESRATKKHRRKATSRRYSASERENLLLAPLSSISHKVSSHNVVDTAVIDAVKSKHVSVQQLKSSVSHYFGAAERQAQGEKFRVLARRVTPEKKIQYLVEWEGVMT